MSHAPVFWRILGVPYSTLGLEQKQAWCLLPCSCAPPPQVSKTVLKAKIEVVVWLETELATVEEGVV